MQALSQEKLVTLEEYLAAEESSSVRREYWAGRVFAMAGGSPTHAMIIFNLSRAFGNALDGHDCQGASNDQRVRIEAVDVELYPDLVIMCPPELYSERDPLALINPSLLVEVLSAGSEKDDRGKKLQQYSLIPSLRDYILVSQKKTLIEHYTREVSANGTLGRWSLTTYNFRNDAVSIESLGISIPLAIVYNNLDLPPGLTPMGGQ